ncbi:MAG: hypothetical protein ACKN9I_02865 [Alphaproteobacteria bacterium]
MEEIFKNYQFTFSAIGAIGSMGAVIISLWLACRTEKAKIKAKLIIENKGDASIYNADFIAVEIINKSSFPIYIELDSFYFDEENIYTYDFLDKDCPIHPIEDLGIRDSDGNYYNPLGDKALKNYPVILNSHRKNVFYLGLKDSIAEKFKKKLKTFEAIKKSLQIKIDNKLYKIDLSNEAKEFFSNYLKKSES